MDDAEDNRDAVRAGVLPIEATNEPVEAVEGAVGTETDKIHRVDDGGDGRLAKEEQLREHADRFEDLGEDPQPL